MAIKLEDGEIQPQQPPPPPPETPSNGDERRPQWANLPDLPLFSITGCLTTPADFSSFHHTCATWRSIPNHAFLASQPPWLISAGYDRLYSISDEKFHVNTTHSDKRVIGFSEGHLILISSSRRLSLADPLTGSTVGSVPSPPPHAFSRAFLTSSPVGSAPSMDCRLVIYDSTLMQHCRVRGGEWRVFRFPTDRRVRTMGMLEGKAFAITMDGKLGVVDFTANSSCPEMKLVVESGCLLFDPRFQGTWLGGCGKNLLAITCSYQLNPPQAVKHFVVRRFDFSTRCWLKIESVDDEKVLFVDLSWGSAMSSNGYRHKNCIYFIDPSRNSLCAFHMKDGRIEDISSSVPTGFRWDLYVWVIPTLCRT